MEVHPPEHAIHNWRDFFIHIGTITIGLLIALGLEALVEQQHHRHLVHTAEANLHTEVRNNRQQLAADEHFLDTSQQQLQAGLASLEAVKAHKPGADFKSAWWEWDGPSFAAWDTARDSGALALMDLQHVQSFAVVYDQQKIVQDQAILFVRDIYSALAPLRGRRITDLNPQQLDSTIANTEHTLADLRLLRDYTEGLERIYDRAENIEL